MWIHASTRRGRYCVRAVVLLSMLAASLSAEGGVVKVIVTNIQSHPTSLVPGVPGVRFRATSDAFQTPYAAPNESRWIIKAFTNELSTVNEVILSGAGATSTLVAKKGSPSPIPGTLIGALESSCAINDSGQFVYSTVLTGGGTDTDAVVIRFDGLGQSIALIENNPVFSLMDPGGTSGDERYGGTFDSLGITSNGSISYRNDNIVNIGAAHRSALMRGSTPLIQEAIAAPGGAIADSFVNTSTSHFKSSLTDWIVTADLDLGAGFNPGIVLNGAVVARLAQPFPPFTSPVSDFFGTDLVASNWFLRGRNGDGANWAARNGVIVAATGRTIFPGSDELWTTNFAFITGSATGGYVVCGSSSLADAARNQVVVINNSVVGVRKGDPIDLDGNSLLDDDCYIRVFNPNSAALTANGVLYFTAGLRNAAGLDLGVGLLRVRLICNGDADSDGVVGLGDLALLIAHWDFDVPPGTLGDINYDGTVNLADLAFVIQYWGENCNE